MSVVPEQISADGFKGLTVRVSTEKDVTTTGVRVEVPEVFTIPRWEPVPAHKLYPLNLRLRIG